MRERYILARDVVESGCQTFGQKPAIDEHDRGPVVLNELDDACVEGGPDAAPLGGARWPGRVVALRGQLAFLHGFVQELDAQVERFARAGINDRDGPRRCAFEAAEQARRLLERPLRCAEPDALQRRGPPRGTNPKPPAGQGPIPPPPFLPTPLNLSAARGI